MQKWEYITVHCKFTPNSFSYTINGGEPVEVEVGPVRGSFFPHVAALLNNLGTEGWELIDTEGVRYSFKRPISD